MTEKPDQLDGQAHGSFHPVVASQVCDCGGTAVRRNFGESDGWFVVTDEGNVPIWAWQCLKCGTIWNCA